MRGRRLQPLPAQRKRHGGWGFRTAPSPLRGRRQRHGWSWGTAQEGGTPPQQEARRRRLRRTRGAAGCR